ncbi:MAG: c-type cytochrome domain-containing protein, partial [Pirellulaceae bacterium]
MNCTRDRRFFPFLAAAALAIGRLAAAEEPLTAEQTEFFEAKIRPVLVKHCYECHSAESKELQGSLKLDSRDGLLKGGDGGPIIKAKDPAHSRLISALKWEELEMPPEGKLPAGVIA